MSNSREMEFDSRLGELEQLCKRLKATVDALALLAPGAPTMLRMMYVTVRPVYQALVPLSYPIPDVGEHIEFGNKRWVIQSRTWDIDERNQPGVALHVREF